MKKEIGLTVDLVDKKWYKIISFPFKLILCPLMIPIGIMCYKLSSYNSIKELIMGYWIDW